MAFSELLAAIQKTLPRYEMIKMTTRNKLDMAFGPVGNSVGIFLFVAGLITNYFSLTGLILILIGAFVGFTSSIILIDFDNKRLKFSK